MIKIFDDYFVLETNSTSYIFGFDEVKHLEHYYYGNKLELTPDIKKTLKQRQEFPIGNGVAYSEDKQHITMENQLLEVSFLGKGDIRHPLVDMTFDDGGSTSDFTFIKAETRTHQKMKTLPTSYDEDNKVEDLVVTLKDEVSGVELNVIYTPYDKDDVITRRLEIVNNSKKGVTINRAMSLQIDMHNDEFNFISFHGSWISEMKKYVQPCVIGTISSESICGVSSSRSNPFVMLASRHATEDCGAVYGFNLIYSGNHIESVDTDTYNHVRFLTGIHPQTFSFNLKPGEVFETPEAVMTYSNKGFSSMSNNMHHFVEKHIVRGEWRDLPRPILNNSWEAAYFRFNEKKILGMAKKAKDAGVELFVLDDGWFGSRNDDTQALGDWFDNKKKLPHGLFGLSKKIHKMGLKFGIWVEPEMVNEKSNLYKEHPTWVIENPNRKQSLGRHQMILDLSQDEVVDYLIDVMSDVFTRSNCEYVKWDMNRIFSDYFSQKLEPKKMKELSHRYYLGFYRLMETLTKKFPHILFEGCASGGNRFDLGMLCYFPQIWASDNTDAKSRVDIQEGYSYGYPLSTLGCHVSDIPNHQTLRKCSIRTRYNVAFFGELGYEFNMKEISKKEFIDVKREIQEYKKYREYLFNGDFYRIKNHNGYHHWLVVSKDKKHAAYLMFQDETRLARSELNLLFRGLDDKTHYLVHSEDYSHSILDFGGLVNQISPIHIKNGGKLHKLLSNFAKMKENGEHIEVNGDLLNSTGLPVSSAFVGTGYNDRTRLMFDFDSRLYLVDTIE